MYTYIYIYTYAYIYIYVHIYICTGCQGAFGAAQHREACVPQLARVALRGLGQRHPRHSTGRPRSAGHS